jgi:hypothetical protein
MVDARSRKDRECQEDSHPQINSKEGYLCWKHCV